MSYTCKESDIPVLLPHSAKLLKLIENDECDLHALARQLEVDPVLCSKLLRVANSSFFGMGGRISGVLEALLVVGLGNTQGFVHTEIIRGLFCTKPWSEVDLTAFWSKSLSMASACQILAHQTAVSPSRVFAAGLMHNLGMLVMIAQFGADYKHLFDQGASSQELVEKEEDKFKTNHALIGADLLEGWGLPRILVNAVRNQYQDPDNTQVEIEAEILRCAHAFSEPLIFDQAMCIDRVDWFHRDLLKIEEHNLNAMFQAMRMKYKSLLMMTGHTAHE